MTGAKHYSRCDSSFVDHARGNDAGSLVLQRRFISLGSLCSFRSLTALSSPLSHPSRTCLNILPQVGFGTKKAQLRGYVDVAVDFVPINPSILARVSPLPVVSIASLHAPSARVAGAMPTRSERGEFFLLIFDSILHTNLMGF